MRLIRYFSKSSLTGIIHVAYCSDCGELAERNIEKEAEQIVIEHAFAHIVEDSQDSQMV